VGEEVLSCWKEGELTFLNKEGELRSDKEGEEMVGGELGEEEEEWL